MMIGEIGFSQEGTNSETFDKEAENGRDDYGKDESSPEGRWKRTRKVYPRYPPISTKWPWAILKAIGALEDDDETYGDEGIDHAKGKTGHYQLKKEDHERTPRIARMVPSTSTEVFPASIALTITE